MVLQDGQSTSGVSSPYRQESKCSECREKPSVYQCPRCDIRTCSLECCRDHKKRTGCSGKRNRATFVPVSQMTDGTVRSDYFFLEGVLSQIPRDGKRPRLQKDESTQTKSKKTRRLVREAERRGTMLQIMPPMMVRHKTNSSWYCAPKDAIMWKVEVIQEPGKASVSFNISEAEENLMVHVMTQFEKANITIPTGAYSLFLPRIPSTATSKKYVKINSPTSLKAVLRNMTVVEHPTLHLVPENLHDQFPTGSDKIKEIPSSAGKAMDAETT